MAPPEVTKMLSNKATELVAKYGGASATIGGAFVLVGDFDYRDKTKKDLIEYISDLESRLDEQRWRVIATGELPVVNDEVLALAIESETYDVGYYDPKYNDGDGWYDYDENYHPWDTPVSHWMPLPKLPGKLTLKKGGDI